MRKKLNINMRNKFIEKIENILLYKKRRERNLKELKVKIHKYVNESDDEFLMDYVDINSRYKYKRFILFVYSLVSLFVVRGVWNYFFTILCKILVSEDPKIVKMESVVIMMIVTIMLTIVTIIALIFFDITRTVYKLNREQIILNEVKKMRKEN
ncbi:MAG: hypothetical protein HFF36_04165 [Coprobacillus sp.]|nr:hypothetical protein [Coprobacillus sp.]